MLKSMMLIAGLGCCPSFAPLWAVEAHDVDQSGCIYGEIHMKSGSVYEGVMRWGKEEAFWGDLFNSLKRDSPYEAYFKENRDRHTKKKKINVFGVTIYASRGSGSSRQFVAEFGHIKEIRVTGEDDADVLMKTGSTFRVSGYANDVGGDIKVWDETLGLVEVDWKKIDRIVFKPTPARVSSPVQRLYGRLKTRSKTFEGYIQWDSEECQFTDRLDGETDDGKLSIPMGKIAAIEKHSRHASLVFLRDGRHFELSGTNDVDDSIRGVFVEDPQFGRVKVSWDTFERVDFEDVSHTGPRYQAYSGAGKMQGSVVTNDRQTFKGEVVIDLDESESWELLNGSADGVEYMIPLSLVRSIEPLGDQSNVLLSDGISLDLDDSADVSSGNAGALVSRQGDDPIYVAWKDIQRIEYR